MNPAAITVVSGQPLSKRTSYQNKLHKVQLEASDEYLKITVAAVIETEAMSVNRPDRIQALRSEVPNARVRYGHPVFTLNGELTVRQSDILDNHRMRGLLDGVRLTDLEIIRIYANGISVYLRGPDVNRSERALDQVVELADVVSGLEKPVDLSGLPQTFITLAPLIKAWGMTDDQERDDLRVNATQAELEHVVMKVEPYLEAIDSYLESFRGRPWSEDAVALSALAEFVVETKAYLRRPDGK